MLPSVDGKTFTANFKGLDDEGKPFNRCRRVRKTIVVSNFLFFRVISAGYGLVHQVGVRQVNWRLSSRTSLKSLLLVDCRQE